MMITRLWDRLARWTLRSRITDADGTGNIYYGDSAVTWHWLTLGDNVLGGTHYIGKGHDGRNIIGHFWHRVAPGTDPDRCIAQLKAAAKQRRRKAG